MTPPATTTSIHDDPVEMEAHGMVRRLVSLDPVESNSAINQYFHPNAKLHSQTLGLSGATTLKEWSQLQSALAIESHVIGEPTYNPATRTIDFAWARTYAISKLPSYIPFRQQLAGASKTLHYQTLLHLDTVEGRLMVTRADVILKEKPPLNGLIPYYLLKPVASVGAKAATVATGFFTRHPATETSVVSLVGHAVNESVSGAYSVVMRTKANAAAQVDYAESQIKPTARELEARAKAAGIPVEQYKAQIASIPDKATDATNAVRIKAKGVTDTALDTAFDVAGGVIVVGNDTTNAALAITNLALDTTFGVINNTVNTAVGAVKKVQHAAYYAVGTVLNTGDDFAKFLMGKKKQAHDQGQQLRKKVADTGVPVTADEIERYLIAEKDQAVKKANTIARNTQEMVEGAVDYAGAKTGQAVNYAGQKKDQAANYAGQVLDTATDIAGNAIETAQDAGMRAQQEAQRLAAQAADTAEGIKQYASDKADEAQQLAAEGAAMAQDKAHEAQQYATDEARRTQGVARDDGTTVHSVDALLIPVEHTDDPTTADLGEPVPVVVEAVETH